MLLKVIGLSIIAVVLGFEIRQFVRDMRSYSDPNYYKGFTLCPHCDLWHHPVLETCAQAREIKGCDDPCRICRGGIHH